MHSRPIVLLLVVSIAVLQVGEARLPEGGEGLTEDMLRQMAEKFNADFMNDDRSIEFTNEQLEWFESLGKNDGEHGNGRKKRQALNPRQEYRTLSTAQRTDLHNAFNAMKSTLIGGMPEYDIFVNMHTIGMAPGAHEGAAFLAWHREFLLRLELALQSHVPGVMLPYWENELDQSLPDPSASAIWTPDYLGNNNGAVITGFAAGWTTPAGCPPSPMLTRAAVTGSSGQSFLFDASHVNQVLNARSYADIYCHHNCDFYCQHIASHEFVGGHLSYSPCTAIDPVFWMLHAYIDCLWEEYRQKPSINQLTDYPTATDPDNGGPPHYPGATMLPFSPLINTDGLSNIYTKFYFYLPRLSQNNCVANVQCLSDLLYCNMFNDKCRAKVRLGGDCTGMFPSSDVCDSTECNLLGLVGMCVSNSCACV